MKRILIFFAVCFISTQVFAQSEELEIYSTLYDSAETVAEQLAFIRIVADANYSGAEAFYAKALNRLVIQYPNLSARSELDAADNAALILSQKLGEANYTPAASNLWMTVTYFSNSLVKAEALMALGRTGNTAFLPQVIRLLETLNLQPQSDREASDRAENTASGAIVALEYFGSPEGYLPVFFAYTGWYSQRVRNLAFGVMSHLMDDPTEPLLTVVNGSSYGYEVKHMALRVSEASESSEANKSRVAVAALTEGWRNRGNDIRQRTELTEMRRLALRMIRLYGTQDSAVYAQLDHSYREGDQDEKLAVLQVLNTMSTEESVRLLSGYLRDIHSRRLSNALTANDEQLVRVIIPALGNVGNVARSVCRPILILVQMAPQWSSAIQRLATDALNRIGV
ncbi:MAG: hypothetical protein LBI14_06415 [Treponema sp.]|jgi:hypothetical protein|nr:hypothetical protein [Treponema sp.]